MQRVNVTGASADLLRQLETTCEGLTAGEAERRLLAHGLNEPARDRMRAYGTIYGAQYTAFLVGMALGPLFAGALFDVRGNYRLAIYGAGAALASAAFFMSRLGSFDSDRQARGTSSATYRAGYTASHP